MSRHLTTFLAATTSFMIAGHALAQSSQATTPVTTTQAVPPVSQIPPGTQLPVVPMNGSGAQTPGLPAKVQVVPPVSGVATPATTGALGADGLPPVDAASIGNVTGLISYCVRHHYVNDTTSRHTGRALARKSIVQTDPGYSIGGQGLLQTGTDTPFAIKTLSMSKKTALCSRIVSRGQTLAQ